MGRLSYVEQVDLRFAQSTLPEHLIQRLQAREICMDRIQKLQEIIKSKDNAGKTQKTD